jgi:UDP:flavonoid glycosyltransferase YjiC (YdhE family)
VTFFNRPITRAIVANAGLAFRQLVDDFESDNAKTAAHNDRFIGPHPVSTIHAHASLVLRTALKAAADEHLDALLVDQADLAAGSVAEALGLPFINVSMFPPVYLNDDVPPFIYHWSPTGWRESQRRNKRRNDFFRLLFKPTLQAVNSSRMKWGLTPARDINELFSRTAIITQLPHVLDFTRTINVPSLFHTNSFYSDMGRPAIDFPWSRLNGKPIIYACMGTVRVESKKIYELIAAACAEFDVQLIMSLGGMSLTPELLRELPGDPIVVHFAPQMEVLRRSVLCITHAGLNTVLEAVANAVPLVAIPVTDDQPGVAARIEWSGIGRSLPFKRVTVEKLREAIGAVLQNEACTTAVRRMQKDLESLDGLDMAADIIERVLR